MSELKQYFKTMAEMIRDAIFSKKFIGVVAASYFLHEGFIESDEWIMIMMVYLGTQVAEKGIDAFKKPGNGNGTPNP